MVHEQPTHGDITTQNCCAHCTGPSNEAKKVCTAEIGAFYVTYKLNLLYSTILSIHWENWSARIGIWKGGLWNIKMCWRIHAGEKPW